jgi:hypothetical protein
MWKRVSKVIQQGGLKMVKITSLTLVLLAVVGAAAGAVEVGVGAFYAPGMVVGPAASSVELNPGGVNARFIIGLSDRASVNVGYSFNNYTYGRWGSPIPEVFVVESVRTDILAVGSEYALAAWPVIPFAGGGAALARESAEAYNYSTSDWYGGLYVEGGARYRFGGRWAVAAGPRYMYLFDEAPLAYDINQPGTLRREEERTQLLDFLFGVNYYF